jgi:hypothetical protein
MRIKLSDPTLMPELLTFLRSRGCIAYSDEEQKGIEALRPHSFGQNESKELADLLDQWRTRHPLVTIDLTSSWTN